MSGFISDVRVFLRDLRTLCAEFFDALTEEEFAISALSDGGVVLSAKPRGSRRADVVVIPAGSGDHDFHQEPQLHHTSH